MRKLILVATAAATLVVPITAVASTGPKTSATSTTAKVCVRQTKHGFKARLSAKKCKRGEKAVTVHLPQGATGPQGPAGATGPAGSFVVKDGAGNAFGTLIAYDGTQDWVMLSNGIIEPFNAYSGLIDDQGQLLYTSTDCSGQGYTDAASPQSPFAPIGANPNAPGGSASPGSTLYVPSGPAQSITINSQGIPGNCQSFGPGGGFDDTQAVVAKATGYVQPGSPVGPLSVAKQ